MFDRYQTLENPALRAYLKLPKDVEGIVIHQPDSDAPDYPLKEWDVLTRIGGQPIDDQGMVRTPNGRAWPSPTSCRRPPTTANCR